QLNADALAIHDQERRAELLHQAPDLGRLERVDETGATSGFLARFAYGHVRHFQYPRNEERPGPTQGPGPRAFCYMSATPATVAMQGLGYASHAMAPQTLTQDPRRELEMLLASRFALIVIESREEQRVLALINEAAARAGRGRNWYAFQWTCTDGLKRADVDMPPQKTLAEPAALLRHLRATPTPGIYVLLDFHPFLNDPVNVRMIKDVAQNYEKTPITIVLLSHEVTVPQELE